MSKSITVRRLTLQFDLTKGAGSQMQQTIAMIEAIGERLYQMPGSPMHLA